MDYQERIRNFCIISHIDHGKSTLADRFLELTGAVSKEKMKPQYLDMMDLEREKGITIKMQPVRMTHNLNLESYILNLIDTPGHVDFSYEVSRALAAVEGAILLVDATKGVQAQTLANLEQARLSFSFKNFKGEIKQQNLIIIPVINKIDRPEAQVEETKKEIISLLNVTEEEIFLVSAKFGANVDMLLEAVVKKIPPPATPGKSDVFRALIFDSKFDSYKGVIAYVRVMEGEIQKEDSICLIAAKAESKIKEIGFFAPELFPADGLKAGEIGYIATGIKEPGKVRVGDTITSLKFKVQSLKLPEPLPGYKEPKPVIFASIYPANLDDFDKLKESLEKLKLNDASFVFEVESQIRLGRGFACGFLGSLHAEITIERLKREFGLDLVISSPSVLFKVINKEGTEVLVKSANQWPDASQIAETQEPWANLEIILPSKFLGKVLQLLEKTENQNLETKYLSQEKIILTTETPLREIIGGFYENLKNVTQGFTSMNYEILEYKKSDLVKLDILIAGVKEEAFSKIAPSSSAFYEGRKLVSKLKEVLPSQMFSVALQAAVGGKIIARETLGTKRRDVLAPLYGGDYTRKRKLLEKQKKGKAKLKQRGQIHLPAKVFLEMFKTKH